MKELKVVDAAGPAVQEKSFDFFFQWHLNESCNLRCRHCYQHGGGDAGGMSLSEVEAVSEEAASTVSGWAEAYGMGFSPSFNITGGEPLLFPGLFEALEVMKGTGFELYLLSNGTLIGPGEARRLAALGLDGVQVSLEGPEEINDLIRGRGSFAQAARGIENLLGAGLEVTVNATLSALNADAMPALMGLSASLGVRRLGFSRVVPCGSGTGLLGDMLPPDRLRRLHEGLVESAPAGLHVLTGDPLSAPCVPGGSGGGADPGVPVGGCAAGFSGLTILHNGTVVPCRRLPLPIGNVRRDSIREIWAESGVLNALRDRDRYQGKCGSCGRWSCCRGCRAIAYAHSASLGHADCLADDPQCYHL